MWLATSVNLALIWKVGRQEEVIHSYTVDNKPNHPAQACETAPQNRQTNTKTSTTKKLFVPIDCFGVGFGFGF